MYRSPSTICTLSEEPERRADLSLVLGVTVDRPELLSTVSILRSERENHAVDQRHRPQHVTRGSEEKPLT